VPPFLRFSLAARHECLKVRHATETAVARWITTPIGRSTSSSLQSLMIAKHKCWDNNPLKRKDISRSSTDEQQYYPDDEKKEVISNELESKVGA